MLHLVVMVIAALLVAVRAGEDWELRSHNVGPVRGKVDERALFQSS